MMKSTSRLFVSLMGVLALTAVLSFGQVVAEAAPKNGTPPAEAGQPPAKKGLILDKDGTLWDLFLKGGWAMWPILGCSVLGLAFFFERLIELRRAKHIPSGFDKELILAVDTRGAEAGLALCLERKSSLARTLYAALLRYGTSRQEMEMAVQDESSRLLYDLRRNCRVIGIMSNIAPMLGLLGTVWGLIQAFDTVAAGGGLGKTESLASGVAVALLTTAFGLVVAIPMLALYHFVKGKADDMAREIEERAIDAIVTIDRKARRSIRRIEDIEENLETKTMSPATPPNIDEAFEEDKDLEKAIITHVPTPAQLIVPPAVKVSGDGTAKPKPASDGQEAQKPS